MARKKKRQIVLSEEIDTTIEGGAVGMAFIVVAIFITFNTDYLINHNLTTIIRWVFLLLGTPIIIATAFKNAKCNNNYLASSFFFLGLALVLHLYVNCIVTRVIGLLFLFVAAFGIIREVLFLLYSLLNKKYNIKKHERVSSFLTLLTTILGLFFAVIQALQQLGTI